tara:strand:+ start:733 stop:1521 length:789 start_codon:yes stop_codon:yes gene_type:complete
MDFKMTPKPKIGILAKKNLNTFQASVLKNISKTFPYCFNIVIIDSRPPESLFQKIKKNIKRKRGGYIIIMFLQRFLWIKQKQISIKDFFDNNTEIINTKNIYSKNIVKKIKDCNLDVLILIDGFGIIKDPVLNITRLGVLSYHHGNMRKYRGMPPGFWELYNNEKEMGATVQLLSSGLDKGSPVEEMTIPIYVSDSIQSLKSRIYQSSTAMMNSALIKILNPNYQIQTLSNIGTLYTLPNLRQYVFLKFKILYRKLLSIWLK